MREHYLLKKKKALFSRIFFTLVILSSFAISFVPIPIRLISIKKSNEILLFFSWYILHSIADSKLKSPRKRLSNGAARNSGILWADTNGFLLTNLTRKLKNWLEIPYSGSHYASSSIWSNRFSPRQPASGSICYNQEAMTPAHVWRSLQISLRNFAKIL